jgi:hypothetical protein
MFFFINETLYMMRFKLTLAFILIFGISQAQKDTEIGIVGGLNFSTYTYTDDAVEGLMSGYRKIKTGTQAGIFIIHELNPMLALSSEIIYSRKGLSYEQAGIREGVNKFNYLQWASAGNYALINKRERNLLFGLGFYTAFWINGSFTHSSLQTGEYFSEPVVFVSPDYEYNRWDVGIKTQIIARNPQKPWVFSLGYEHGMLESSKKAADSFRNRLLFVTLAYSFIRK